MRYVRTGAVAFPAAVVVLLAVAGPFLAAHPATEPVDIPYATPSAAALLGTDHLGQDVAGRVLLGGWGLLLLAAVIAVLVTAAAAVTGAVAALRPAIGALIERTTDALMLAPPVLAILVVMLSWPESGTIGLVAIAVVVGTPYAARVFAAAAARTAVSGYVEVAVASGERLPYLIFREVLPNLRETVATQLGLRFVEATYLVSTAAFLQLPTSLGETNWALMVRENSAGIMLNPAAVVAPAVAIGVLAVSVNATIGVFGRRMVTA
ncbi:ABC transporter permease subunit [Nocardia sp. CA2R105]|uniref:ABC transporter permease subunit n=1 Tax=Nocardia coffeae TaxID=2873381 RepID=UPI001CA6D979|nr:ABC transporter permease subunit [Nocardia coffeae]MBY8859245.1 ABC transporter permease subunit [Nocardia coffeae]